MKALFNTAALWTVVMYGGIEDAARAEQARGTQVVGVQQAEANKQERASENRKQKVAKNRSEGPPEWVWKNPQTPAGTQLKTFKSATLQGQEASYLLWLPPGYESNPTQRYPVAYFLHGGGGNYMHIPEAFLPQAAEAIAAGRVPPFLAVAVNGLPSSFYVDSHDGRTPVESVIMKDLLPHIDATYRTSDVRLIEGFSMGGRGAAYLAFKYPDQFRGVADFAGAIHDWSFFGRLQTVAQLFEDERAFAKAWPFNLVRESAGKVRANYPAGVLIVVGEEDTSRGSTRDWNVKLHETLDELKIPNELYLVKGVRHSYQQLAVDAEVSKRHLQYYAAVFGPQR